MTPLIDVLLVLLIIFLVMMPIMLRSEALELPPRVAEQATEPGVVVSLKLEADLSASLDDGQVFPSQELASRLRSKLPTSIKAVFVDFVDGVPWQAVIATVDTIRGVANDVGHGDVVVALRLRGEDLAAR